MGIQRSREAYKVDGDSKPSTPGRKEPSQAWSPPPRSLFNSRASAGEKPKYRAAAPLQRLVRASSAMMTKAYSEPAGTREPVPMPTKKFSASTGSTSSSRSSRDTVTSAEGPAIPGLRSRADLRPPPDLVLPEDPPGSPPEVVCQRSEPGPAGSPQHTRPSSTTKSSRGATTPKSARSSPQHWWAPPQPEVPPPLMEKGADDGTLSTPTARSNGRATGPRKRGARRSFTAPPTTQRPNPPSPSDSPVLKVDADGEQRIRRCKKFADLYELSRKFMPSVHRCTELRTAVRRSDQEEVVVKIRGKKGAFHNSDEEKAFRLSCDALLELTEGGGGAGIACIHEVLEDESAYYVVMEKVGGLDLHQTVKLRGKLPVEEVRGILYQLLQGVQRLHSRGLIHRDLKLDNVMLDPTPRMGLSRTATGLSGAPSQSSSLNGTMTSLNGTLTSLNGTLTSLQSTGTGDAPPPPPPPPEWRGTFRGTVKLIDFDIIERWPSRWSEKAARDVLGTDQYISPEAYEGRYSPASDMFAVGVIAYKLLTGCFPFRDGIFDDKPGDNWVGSPKMRQIKARLEGEKLDWQHPVFASLPGLQQLLARMLSACEFYRPSVDDALADAWFCPPQSALRRECSLVSTHWLLPNSVDDDV